MLANQAVHGAVSVLQFMACKTMHGGIIDNQLLLFSAQSE
jgi:hypothetical protein